MSRFLRYLACLVTLMFVGNALAAGYDCSVYKKYTSCNSGYYISNCGTSGWTGQTISSGSLTVGNSCKACPSGYKCSGGLVCPKANTVTCSAGYYLPANATSCSACGGNNYYCPGGTYTPSSSAQGRKTVSSGYYSTGGTSTTRTGQSQCGGNNYYCSGGVRNTVSSGYYSTGGTSTTRTGQSQCTGATYCSGGVKSNCPSGYTANTTAGKTSASSCQISCAGGTYVATAKAACTSVGTGYYRAAHTVNYGSTSTRTQCPANYRSGAAASAQSGCKTSCAGGTYVATANAACTSVGTGYYKAAHTVNYGSTSTRTQCPANYRSGAAASAQSGCKTSCAGGTYVAKANAACTSVGTGYYKAAHTVNYGGTSTRSACPSGYDDGAAASAQSGCKISVAGGKYIKTANSATQSTCSAGTYKAAHTVSYGSTSSCSACTGRTKYSAAGASACSTVSSGYYTTGCNSSNNNCTGQSQCGGNNYYCSGGVRNTVSSGYYSTGGTSTTRTGQSQCGGNNYYCSGGVRNTVSSGYYSTGGTSTTRTGQAICEAGYYCASGVRNSCSGSLQYQNEKGKTSCKSVSVGYYKSSNTAQAQCDAGYRNIAATSRNECVGSFTKTGSQVNGSVPTNCSSVTSWNSCTPGTCTYTKKYSGTIVSNCTPTNCTKTADTTTGKAGYYGYSNGSGQACSSCSSFNASYPSSANGAANSSACYKTCSNQSITNGTNIPNSTKAYYPNNCTYSPSCNGGYYLSNGQCVDCGKGYYCVAGSNVRVSCSSTVPSSAPTPSLIISLSNGSWSDNNHAISRNDCVCDWYFSDETRTQYINERTCYLGPGGIINYTRYQWCRTGYYASDPLNFNSWYNSCSACTNKPANSTYTGRGTPSTMYAVENNCPWQCNDGYYKDGNTCKECGGNNYYCKGGTRYTVSAGHYSTGGTSTTRTGQSQCTGATYCSGGVKNTCPGSYTANTTAGKTAPSACQIRVSAGKYIATANSSTQTTCTAGYACPGGLVNYGSTGKRTQCTGATYAGSGASSCSNCPSGYTANTTAGKTAASACQISVAAGKYIKTANSATQSTCTAGYACPGGLVNYGSTGKRTQCTGATYAGSGASSCSNCPSGYDDDTTAGKTAASSCKISVAGGKYIKTANSATQSTCSAGTYKAAHTVSYGSTSSCSACTGRTKYSAAGASACSTVSSGYYTTGCNTSNNNCTGQSQCTGATYCSSGVKNNCPSGYDDNTTAGKTAASSCQISCAGGTYVATANAACTSVGTGYYKAAHTVNYGSTSTRSACPSGYDDGAAASAQSGCKISVSGGKYIATANATSATTCPNWTYKGSHTVKYGSTSSCSACIDVDSGWSKASGTGWTSYSSCKETRAATSISSYCSSGQLTKTQSSASAWGTATVSATFQADPGAYVTGSGASSSCSRCTSGYYCTGGTAARQSCSSLASGFYPNSAAGSDAASDCYTDSLSGKYVATANATSATTCPNWTYKGSHTVKYGSTSSCSACIDVDSGWSKASGTGWTSYSSCKETRAATSISSYCSSGQLTKTQSSASAWGTATVSATFQADPGAYVTGSGASSSCSRCGANDYCAGGTAAAKDCPSGYPNSAAGSSLITQCYSNTKSRAWTGSQTACTKPTGCYSVTCNACSGEACSYVAYSNSTGTGDGTIKSGCSTNNASCQQTVNTVTANAGRYVSGKTCPVCSVGTYQGTNGATVTSCSVCSGNTYAASEGMSACSSCPSGYSISGTTAANHDAKSDCKISCAAGTQVVTADAACTTPADSWYSAAHTVPAGSTSGTNVKDCLTNYYTPDTTTRTDHDSSTDCKISCSAGTRIVSANATSCTTPSGNWYIGAHSVSQGSTSSVNSCLANYTISGTAATNHDAANDCKITCSGGSYIATANNTSCSPVGAGFWAAASTVSQGSAGLRNACADGLTTIGSGSGADEAGDCGRVLNFNGEKVYLRSDKKTTPSLNVSISGKTFYGNMGTGVDGALKIKSGSTTYSVYDDSME